MRTVLETAARTPAEKSFAAALLASCGSSIPSCMDGFLVYHAVVYIFS